MSNEETGITKENQLLRLKSKQMQRQEKNRRRRLRAFRNWLKFFLVVLMMGFTYLLVTLPQWYLSPAAFDRVVNPSLEITNNKIVPSHKVLSALRCNPVPKEPIFMVKTDALKESIMHLEPVQDVYIRRFWFPARLKIIIIERTPVITISPEFDVHPIAFFSMDGKLIGREYMPLDSSYQTWLILTYGTKDDYRTWDEPKVRKFRNIAQAVEDLSGEKVEYIDYKNPDDVYIKIQSANIRLGRFSTTTMERLARIPSLLPQVKMLNKKVKYIDLRWEKTNYIKLDE